MASNMREERGVWGRRAVDGEEGRRAVYAAVGNVDRGPKSQPWLSNNQG